MIGCPPAIAAPDTQPTPIHVLTEKPGQRHRGGAVRPLEATHFDL